MWRSSLALVVLVGLILGCHSLFEDQIGKDDWYGVHVPLVRFLQPVSIRVDGLLVYLR